MVGKYSSPIGAGMIKKSQLLPFVTLSSPFHIEYQKPVDFGHLKPPLKGSMRRTPGLL